MTYLDDNIRKINELEKKCLRYETVISGTEETFYEYNSETDMITIFFSLGDGHIEMRDIPDFMKNVENNIYIYEDDKPIVCNLSENTSSGRVQFDVRMRMHSDKEFEWYRVTAKPDKREGYFAGSARNVNEEKLEEERLKEKALIDPLSKVYNRAAAIEKIEQSLCKRLDDCECALIVMDIDNFKNINDTYGHLYGDAVIAMAAGGIRSTLDADDIIGRFGGDEFFVFIDNAERAELERKLENIRQAVLKMRLDANDEDDISCSIGVAVGRGSDKYEELFRQADSALYKAKKCGKNRFEYFDGTYTDEAAISYTERQNEDESNEAHNITAVALEIASKSTNAVNAVSNIMRHIGVALELDCIQIMEFDTIEDKVYLGYQWWRKTDDGTYNVVVTEKKMGYYEHNDLIIFRNRFAKDKIFRYTPDFKEGFSQKYKDVFKKAEKINMVYSSNTEKENVFYAVAFQCWDKNRVWLDSELKDMFEITKILSMYLKASYVTTDREKMLMERLDYRHGLYSLQKFYEEAGRIGREARANDEMLAVVDFDIKNLYKINITHGGDVGDEMLHALRKKLKEADKTRAISCQITGTDIFITLLRTKNRDIVADEIVKAMEDVCAPFAQYSDPPFIIKAAICFFNPGGYISDYVDAVRAAKKGVEFDRCKCIVVEDAPTAYKNADWHKQIE